MAHEKTDVVEAHRGAIVRRTGERNFEFSRQIGELGMKRRPLPDDLGIRPRVFDFIGCHAGKLIGRYISDAIPAGLNRVHLHISELIEEQERKGGS